MVTIISERKNVWVEDFRHVFAWASDLDAGFAFPFNEDGVVDVEAMHPAGQENYLACLDGTYDVIDLGVRDDGYYRTQPRIVECPRCDRHIECWDSWENECFCGVTVNGFGQEVRRTRWFEETGEHISDVFGPDPEAVGW